MEVKDGKIYFRDIERQNSGLSCSTLPLVAARVVAERLLEEARPALDVQDEVNSWVYGGIPDANQTASILLGPFNMAIVAIGLLKIADDYLGKEK